MQRERGGQGGGTGAQREHGGSARDAKDVAVGKLSPVGDAAVGEREAAAARLAAAEGAARMRSVPYLKAKSTHGALRKEHETRATQLALALTRVDSSAQRRRRAEEDGERSMRYLEVHGAARESAAGSHRVCRDQGRARRRPSPRWPKAARTTTTTPATMTAMTAMTDEHEHGAQSSHHAVVYTLDHTDTGGSVRNRRRS